MRGTNNETRVEQNRLTVREGPFKTKYLDRAFHDNLLKVNKKGLLFIEQPFKKLTLNLVSTQEEIRTPTPFQAPAPQAGASTNFATWVNTMQI